MTLYSSRDFLAVARARYDFLRQQKEQLQQEARAYSDDIARLDTLHQRTRDELASYLLAEVGDDDLRALQDRLRYPGLLGIKQQFEAELRQSEAERVALEATPEIEEMETKLNDTTAVEGDLDTLIGKLGKATDVLL